jgi:hypothetical protein
VRVVHAVGVQDKIDEPAAAAFVVRASHPTMRPILVLLAAVLTVAGCASTGSDTVSGSGASVTSMPTTAQTTTAMPDPEPAVTPQPASVTGTTNSVGGNLNTIPPDQPGGSAIKVITPCDSGISTLSAYPKGDGVAMTETLRNVAHRKWKAYPFITPTVALDRDPNLTTYTARHGVVTITATNLIGVDDDVNYAWPQQAEVSSLSAISGVPTCFGSIYLGSKATAHMHNLTVEVLPTVGSINISNNAILPSGIWRIRVEVTSPTGVQHKTTIVDADKTDMGGLTRFKFATTFNDIVNLGDFTSVAVTATNDTHHVRTWLTMIRTP